MHFAITGDCDEVVNRLFKMCDHGHVMFGPAMSNEQISRLDELKEWTLFSDYILEGGASYFVRIVESTDTCELEIRLTGGNRDFAVPSAIRFYIEFAGFEFTES